MVEKEIEKEKQRGRERSEIYIYIYVEREKFLTYHKLTHHTIEFTKYSQLQSTAYCC